MLPYLRDDYGNPGSVHAMGRKARDAVDRAREQVAGLFNARPEQIIFTSSGSEANNFAIRNLCERCLKSDDDMVLTSELEHESVYSTLRAIAGDRRVMYARPYGFGQIGLEPVSRILDASNVRTAFVSLMYMNNETGAVSSIPAIAAVCSTKGIPIHVDCVQAAGFLDIDSQRILFDMATISSHKLHGPKGAGAVFVRDLEKLHPLIHGGAHQEFGLRGGTENVPAIVGFGEACLIANENLTGIYLGVSRLRDLFIREITGAFGALDIDFDFNSFIEEKSKIVSLRVPGVDAESLILALDALGVEVSAGSACHAHENTPSRALTSMGLTPQQARETIRVSFSSQNTPAEVEEAARIIAHAANLLLNAKEAHAYLTGF